MLTVYSLGDLDLIIKMAQSAELAFSDGGIANSNLIAIGLGITLLVSAFKQMFDPDKFHVKEFFIALFTYMFLFTPKVDFYIESVRTGEVSQSFTLPFGIVAPAALATMIGGGFAKGMSEAYSSIMPDYDTEPGTNIDPLKALLKARFVGTSEADASYRSVGENMSAYLKNCYFEDIRNGKNPTGQAVQEISHDDSVTGAFDWSKFKVTSGSWFTPYYDVNTKSYSKITCTDAFAKLGTEISDSSSWAEEMKSRAAVLFDMAESSQVEKVFESLTNDTANLINLYRANFVKTMLSKVGATYVELEPWENLAFQQEFDAIQQRHMSQAAQSSFFLESAPALITWFECFIFLVAPLLPVFLTFGSKGLMMAGKLYSFLLAVNFWPIIQVGVNMYTNHYFNKLMCSLPGNNSSQVQNCMIAPSMRNWSIDSLGGMDSAYTTLETFVSQAAIIQTMVPALAMMIVFGGVHTMMAASQKSQMGANVDAKALSPQTVNSDGKTVSSGGYGAQMTSSGDWIESRQGAGNMSSVSTGGATYNAQQAGTSAVNLSNSDVDSVSASKTAAQQQVAAANERLMTSVGTGNVYQNAGQAGLGYEEARGFDVSQQLGRDMGISGQQARQQMIQTLSQMSEQEANQFALKAGFGVQAGGGMPTNPVTGLMKALGVSTEASASWSQIQTSMKTQLESEGASTSSTLAETASEKAAKAFRESDSASNRKSYAESQTDTSSANYQNVKSRDQAVANQRSAQEQLQEAEARSRELRNGVTSSGAAGSSANIKFGEIISSENRDMFSKTDTLGKIAKDSADGVMRGKYGEDWEAATKGLNTLDYNSTINALDTRAVAAGSGTADEAKYNAMKQDYAGNQSLYDVARDKQALQGIVNDAQTMISPDGRPIPIKDVGSIADRAVGKLSDLMASTQSDPIKASAIQNLTAGAAISYAALNGTNGGNETARLVGAQFTSIGQSQLLDYEKPALTSEQQAFKTDTQAGLNATGQHVSSDGAKLEQEAGNRASMYAPSKEKFDALQLQSTAKWTPDQQHTLSKLDKTVDDLWKKMQESQQISGPAGVSKIIDTVAQELKSGTYGAVSSQVVDRVADVMKNASSSPAELGRMLNDFANSKSNSFSGDNAAQIAPVISAMANTVDGLLSKAIDSDRLSPSEKPYFQNAQQAFGSVNDVYAGKEISDRPSHAGNAAAQVISTLGSSKDAHTQQAVALASAIAAEGTRDNPLPNAEFSRYYKENNPSKDEVLGMRLVTDRAQDIVKHALGQEGLSEPVRERLGETLKGLQEFERKLATSPNSTAFHRDATGYQHATAFDDATRNSSAMSGLDSSERIRVMDGFNRIGAGEGSTESRKENVRFNGEGANMRLESIANNLSAEDKASILQSIPESVRHNVERGMELAASNSSSTSEVMRLGETRFPSSPVSTSAAQGDAVSPSSPVSTSAAQGDAVSQPSPVSTSAAQVDAVSQPSPVSTSAAQGDAVNPSSPVSTSAAPGDAVSQLSPVSTSAAPGDAVSQLSPVSTSAAPGDAVSQLSPVSTSAAQVDAVSQPSPVSTSAAQGDAVSQPSPVSTSAAPGDAVSQLSPVSTSAAPGDAVSQLSPVSTSAAQGDAVSQPSPVSTSAAPGDAVSQLSPVSTSAAQGDAVSQPSPVSTSAAQGDAVNPSSPVSTSAAPGDAVSQLSPGTTGTVQGVGINPDMGLTSVTPTANSTHSVGDSSTVVSSSASPERGEPEIRYVETPAENSVQPGNTVVDNNPYAFDGNQAGHNFSVMGGFGNNVQPSKVSYNSIDLVGGGSASSHSNVGTSSDPSLDNSSSTVPTMQR
ncbi:conjugal transfer protein TraG N-terminal domain-containing protein [Shewanella oncorhynchi]|uniref:conjugal transfer protein TraG N-terminal domain-containing protein n=2 Tax=Shewanella TaxID=22 RepID=UPI003D79CC46